MLIAFAGLPGAGKTTLSRAMSRRIGAVWLRVDAIEGAMRQDGVPGLSRLSRRRVSDCGYEPWTRERLSPDRAIAIVLAAVSAPSNTAP